MEFLIHLQDACFRNLYSLMDSMVAPFVWTLERLLQQVWMEEPMLTHLILQEELAIAKNELTKKPLNMHVQQTVCFSRVNKLLCME